jgi:hypothetical protein
MTPPVHQGPLPCRKRRLCQGQALLAATRPLTFAALLPAVWYRGRWTRMPPAGAPDMDIPAKDKNQKAYSARRLMTILIS